ncbi:flagellar hook-length control protein FliK [Helicobacter rodentium]|uniref:flagellar hook-length control protein FliK n=1 Tax=Helicobacter rodentium TaxID=59617 RepID=UPI00047CCAFE|nr:flagellar hook-length control protein FliK [Helicobacter rodentium]
MLPLLEIEKVNQKNVIKTQTSKSENESQNEEFAEIFNFLSLNKNSKKTESKSKEIPTPKTQEDSKNPPLMKNENYQSNILKSLDEKYNLSKNFLDTQKVDTQNKNIKANVLKNQTSLPIRSTLNSARDLLEYSKTQKQESKTLKDLGEVADTLKLNLQKISMQVGEQEQNKKSKGVLKQEIFSDKEVLKESLNTKENIKTNKESSNILSSLLQDKELREKADKTSKTNPTQKTTDSKEPKLTSQDSKEVKSVESQSKENNVSSKTPKENLTQKTTDSKEPKLTSQDSKEVKSVESQSKENNVSSKTPKENLTQKTTDSKEAKLTRQDSKGVKSVESQSKENNVSSKKTSNQEVSVKNSQEKIENPLKEKLTKTESPQDKVSQEPIKQESFKQESLKDSLQKEEKLHENVEQQKTSKEAIKQESQSQKVTNQSRVVQDSMQNPFSFKEKKEVKDSFIKEEKEDKRNVRNPKESITKNSNNFSFLKEENLRQEMKQQDIFLDNLLKTTEKPMQSSKETFKEVAQEGIKENTEKKAKVNQEVYQSSTQAQVENRLSVQNTFLHFSDKLKEALQNYRPPVTKLSLELNPEKLGSVELTIVKRGDNISVQISSNQNALQLFMQNAQEFKNSLSNLGFNDVNLDFKDNTGNSLGGGDFSGSSGGEQGGFGGQNQRNPNPQEQNLEQDFSENSRNTQSWNENSLHTYKEVNNPYARVALVEINFSYYA